MGLDAILAAGINSLTIVMTFPTVANRYLWPSARSLSMSAIRTADCIIVRPPDGRCVSILDTPILNPEVPIVCRPSAHVLITESKP